MTRRSPAHRATAQACVALLVGALAGCGLGAGPAPRAIALLVTSGFGAHTLPARGPLAISGQETVMSLLRRNHTVSSRYGGGFVESIDGLSGGAEGGHPVDWFYYVNGVEAARGAAATNVSPGDHIWWDRHDWSQTPSVPAVVGSFPEPFLNGLGGKRLPVRVECETVGDAACAAVTASLHAAGVPSATAAPGSGSGAHTLRVLVGVWARLGADPAASAIAVGPSASGVYVRFAGGGRSLSLLDADGRARSVLGAGAGLVAATRSGEDAPVWVVTGTDPAGVRRAAGALDARTLAGHFALAVSSTGAIALPLGSA